MATADFSQQNDQHINDACLYSKILLIKLQDIAVNRVIENKIPQDGQDWEITPNDAKAIFLEIETVLSKIYMDQNSGLIKMKAEVCALLQPRPNVPENSSKDVTPILQGGKVVDSLSSPENSTLHITHDANKDPLQDNTSTLSHWLISYFNNLFNKKKTKERRMMVIDACPDSVNTAIKDPIQDVKVITPLQSGAITNFFKVFEKKLEEHGLRAIETCLDTVNTETTSTDVVIVICHSHSRLESNVANALTKIQDRKYKVFLVVLHINKLTELPKESSKQSLTRDTSFDSFDSIYDIVDIAFTKEEGIYDCPMNTVAFQSLENLKSNKKNYVVE